MTIQTRFNIGDRLKVIRPKTAYWPALTTECVVGQIQVKTLIGEPERFVIEYRALTSSGSGYMRGTWFAEGWCTKIGDTK